jgi:hypothetical protein
MAIARRVDRAGRNFLAKALEYFAGWRPCGMHRALLKGSGDGLWTRCGIEDRGGPLLLGSACTGTRPGASHTRASSRPGAQQATPLNSPGKPVAGPWRGVRMVGFIRTARQELGRSRWTLNDPPLLLLGGTPALTASSGTGTGQHGCRSRRPRFLTHRSFRLTRVAGRRLLSSGPWSGCSCLAAAVPRSL